jgi:hypothetical protein
LLIIINNRDLELSNTSCGPNPELIVDQS